jgi:cytochrome P450 / NADPH-cytochrome P450 reductase
MEDFPGPKGLPIVGNMFDVMDKEAPLKGLERLAEVYGPVYKMNILGRRTIVVTSAEVLKEVTEEKHFIKLPPAAIADKGGEAAGLFTARSDDPDWHQAHRILMPEYGPMKIEAMFDGK